MAKASGATQKSKCPPQSVSASGDPINEYIKNVSKNIKKGKGDKGCKGCDQALNVSLGLRSIYRVLGDSKFVAEAKQAEVNLKAISKLSVMKKVGVIMKLFGNVIETVSAISAKEGIPLPDLLISIAKKKGMIDNMMDVVQSTLFDFINIVKTIDNEISLKQTFKVYSIVQSFSKTVKTLVWGMISMMVLQKFKNFDKTKDTLFGMISDVLSMYASVSTIMSSKINEKDINKNILKLKKGLNTLISGVILPFGSIKEGTIEVEINDNKGKKIGTRKVLLEDVSKNFIGLNKALNELLITHQFIQKLSKKALLTTLAMPGLLLSNYMIKVAMVSFEKMLDSNLITGLAIEKGAKPGFMDKIVSLFGKQKDNKKPQQQVTIFLDKIKSFQTVLNAMLKAYIKVSLVLGTISIIMLAVGGIAGFTKLGIAIGLIGATIWGMLKIIQIMDSVFEKSQLDNKRIININLSLGLIMLSFFGISASLMLLDKYVDNINIIF